MGAQVKREISIMKLVRHPYVVQLREVLASSSKIFLVCELITGGELFDKIVEKQVGDEVVRRCCKNKVTLSLLFLVSNTEQLSSFGDQCNQLVTSQQSAKVAACSSLTETSSTQSLPREKGVHCSHMAHHFDFFYILWIVVCLANLHIICLKVDPTVRMCVYLPVTI